MQGVAKIIGPLIFLAILVGIALRVDTNGWGSIVWIALVVGMQVIRAPFEAKTSENTIVRKDEEGTETALLAAVGIGSALIPIVHLLTGVLGFADYDLPDWATAIGAVLVVPGLWLFWRSHSDLGRNWSVTTEMREDHTLVTSGIYERIRHPMYTAIWLLFLVVPLLVHNWIAGFAGAAAFAVMYVLRVPYEEKMMVDAFGSEYEEYMTRSGRLLPGRG